MTEWMWKSMTTPGPEVSVKFADLIAATQARYEEAIVEEREAYQNSPFAKIMRQRNVEMCLLYGNMDNYFMMKDYL